MLALEDTFLESGEPFKASAAITFAMKPLVEDLQNWERSFNKFRDRRRFLHMKNGKRGSRARIGLGRSSGCGMIRDREILQPTVSIQTDASRADSPQRHGDLRGLIAGESALRTATKKFVQ